MSLFSKRHTPDEAGALPFEGKLAEFDGATGCSTRRPQPRRPARAGSCSSTLDVTPAFNWLRNARLRPRVGREDYEDQGLVVVGVHTPDVPFERDVDNVRRGPRSEMRVEYPIALDSGYAVWEAFGNQLLAGCVHSPMRKERILAPPSSGKVATKSASGLSSVCWRRPEERDQRRPRCRSPRTGSSFRPIWRTARLPSPISGTSRPRASLRPGGVRRNELRSYDSPEQLRPTPVGSRRKWTVGGQGVRAGRSRLVGSCSLPRARRPPRHVTRMRRGRSVPFRVTRRRGTSR